LQSMKRNYYFYVNIIMIFVNRCFPFFPWYIRKTIFWYLPYLSGVSCPSFANEMSVLRWLIGFYWFFWIFLFCFYWCDSSLECTNIGRTSQRRVPWVPGRNSNRGPTLRQASVLRNTIETLQYVLEHPEGYGTCRSIVRLWLTWFERLHVIFATLILSFSLLFNFAYMIGVGPEQVRSLRSPGCRRTSTLWSVWCSRYVKHSFKIMIT
jgi:hypothetical protein